MTKLIASLALALFPALSITAALPQADEIVGGDEAASAQFPSQVALLFENRLFCGGVALNPKTLMTAGHCSQTYSANEVQARFGSNVYNSGGTLVNITSILTHPDYNASIVDNDISLWTLDEPIEESDTIKFITLPEQGSDLAEGEATTVSGWGTTTEGVSSLPLNLRFADISVVARDTCSTKYEKQGTITENMFCAADPGKDSCQGDSGGPIVVKNTGVLAGLVSWGNGCAREEFPGVYSRIGNYVSWINENKS
ncbi:hypothetical protein QTJ16_004748 [Diplocarpon rosae]|uniref:Peptidase S1 domain-containing protein n=1 Tax=Diplocarpon rosae TaxID=946125 RepID=A0AAD9SXM8_9HELO|nr:hypothetical protein QTJ16_004748 [Diplocarpon rosae]